MVDKQTCRQKVSEHPGCFPGAVREQWYRVAAGRVAQLRMANYLKIHQAIAQ